MSSYMQNIKIIREELPHAAALLNEDGTANERTLGGFLDDLKDTAGELAKAYGNADRENTKYIGNAFHDPEAMRVLAGHAYNHLDKLVERVVWTLLLLGTPPARLCALFVDGWSRSSHRFPLVVVEMEGGLVQNVYTNTPCEYMTVDLDTEGSDPEDLKTIPGMDEAHVSGVYECTLNPSLVERARSVGEN